MSGPWIWTDKFFLNSLALTNPWFKKFRYNELFSAPFTMKCFRSVSLERTTSQKIVHNNRLRPSPSLWKKYLQKSQSRKQNNQVWWKWSLIVTKCGIFSPDCNHDHQPNQTTKEAWMFSLLTGKWDHLKRALRRVKEAELCARNCWPFRKVIVKKITGRSFSSHRFLLNSAATLNSLSPNFKVIKRLSESQKSTRITWSFVKMCQEDLNHCLSLSPLWDKRATKAHMQRRFMFSAKEGLWAKQEHFWKVEELNAPIMSNSRDNLTSGKRRTNVTKFCHLGWKSFLWRQIEYASRRPKEIL